MAKGKEFCLAYTRCPNCSGELAPLLLFGAYELRDAATNLNNYYVSG